ncbi:MAG: hypothetical protein ACI9MB_002558 [Verrucomicrobiales bacterium]|jgi:hypothetical protein
MTSARWAISNLPRNLLAGQIELEFDQSSRKADVLVEVPCSPVHLANDADSCGALCTKCRKCG